MNIQTITNTIRTWINIDTQQHVQYESDTDTYYYFDRDNRITAHWTSQDNENIIKLCASGVQTVYLEYNDHIDNPKFVHHILTSK